MSRRPSPCLASADREAIAGVRDGRRARRRSPYFAVVAAPRSTRRRARRGRRGVGRRSTAAPGPCRRAAASPAPRYACHCTFTVSATLSRSIGLGGVVHEHVGAGVAVEVGEADHGAAREHVRRRRRPARSLVPEHRSGAIDSPARSTTPIASAAGTVGWCSARRTPCAARASRAATVVLVSGGALVARLSWGREPARFRRGVESWTPNVRDAAGAGQGSARCCSRGRHERGATFPAWSPPASPNRPSHRPPAPQRRARRRRRPASRDRRRRQRSCSPNGASAARRWPRSPAGAVCSSRRSTTTSAARSERARRDRGRGQPGAARAGRRGSGPRRRLARGAALPGHPGRRGGLVRPALRPQRDPPPRRPRPRARSPATGPSASSWWRRSPASCRAASSGASCATVDPRLTALTMMSNDEGTQNWLRVAGSRRCPACTTGAAERHAVGAFLADLTVRGLLVAPRDARSGAPGRRRARRRRRVPADPRPFPGADWKNPVRRAKPERVSNDLRQKQPTRTVLAIHRVRRFTWALEHVGQVGRRRFIAVVVVAVVGRRPPACWRRRPRTRPSSTS